MKYLILNGPSYPASDPLGFYRGTDRREPTYCDELPKDHEINQLFLWYLEETEETGYIRDLAAAHRYALSCNTYFADKRFEVIGVTQGAEKTDSEASFLGFDIGGGNSLINLALIPPLTQDVSENPGAVLSELIRRYFRPRLNQFGLFPTFEDASSCRRAMIALQTFQPNWYEGGDLDVFEITAVYLMTTVA